ncbi:MAG: hypothetical protein ACE5PT_14595 [Gemmatimonadales bacterium]
MKLNIKALTITGAILFGASILLTGIANLLFSSYGVTALEVMASLYPGYHGPDGFGSVIVGTLYAVVDGAIVGAVTAWLYNVFVGGEAPTAA